jgi:diguanylate cyclase (GGDEF)-like protein
MKIWLKNRSLMEKAIPIKIQKVANNEMNRAIRIKYPLSLAVIEINRVSEINLEQGKAIHNQLLIAFQKICQKNIREIDSVFNLYDNDYILFLPGAGREHAYVAGERIHLVASNGIPISSDLVIPIQISIGISTFQDNQITVETLFDQAELALMQAKKTGNNRVVGFEDI